MSDDVEKEKGNAAFLREDYASALNHYNNAITNAGSGAGAALFSNKAAALLKLSKYDDCIQQCLKGLAAPGLHSELKIKIFCRMATAYEAQEKVEEAMEAFKNCEITPMVFVNYNELLRKLWVRNPDAMRAYCNQQLGLARASGADTIGPLLALLEEPTSMAGETPKESRAELISQHNLKIELYRDLRLLYHSRNRLLKFASPNAPGSGHVCSALLSDLKPISIGELRFGEVNVGKLLICRTIADPVPALTTLIEDPAGAVARLSLFNWCSPDEDAGKPAIRVDTYADVLYLEHTHALLKGVEWQNVAPGAPQASSGKSVGAESWESFEKRGNGFFVARNYELAVASYTDAIELKRKVAPEKEVADLLANRAAAYLADEKPMDAFWDCQSALFVQPGHVKATFRLAKAHAGLSKYEAAKAVLEKSPHATRPDFQKEISRLNLRSREQQFGEYDLKALLKEAESSKTPHLDHADYNGGVEVNWISDEKGNGLVALRDFAPGDLLFVEKAFEAIYKSEWATLQTSVIAGELATGEPSLDECVSRIIRRIAKNKDLIKVDEGDAAPAIDAARVAAIVSLNTIGSLGLQVQSPGQDGLRSFDEVRSGFYFGGRGLWILASFMNHSCSPSTDRFFVGDLLFVRASKRIAKGEELTSSYAEGKSRYEERQKTLAVYGFRCKCELCVCDVKRVSDQPSLERQRDAAIESFNAKIGCYAIDNPKSLAKGVDDVRVFADGFASRLAYKDRYDVSLQRLYKSLGYGYTKQRQWLQAAKAFEVAYSAVVGNGTQTTDTFSDGYWSKDAIMFLCFDIVSCYQLAEEFGKAKEYLGKLQSTAKLALGSDDRDLLAMLYPDLPVQTLFENAFCS